MHRCYRVWSFLKVLSMVTSGDQLIKLDYWSLGIFTFPAPARVNCYIQFSFNVELGSLTGKSVSVSKCLK